MYDVQVKNDVLVFKSSSRLCYVDRIVNECKSYLNNLDFEDTSDIILIIRELLINAIEHGNENLLEKKITSRIEYIGRSRFKITVEDEGDGFEYKRLNLALPKHAHGGRRCGYPLIYALADMIKFNEKGNKVTVYVTVPVRIDFKIDFNKNHILITPSGDLTAINAEEFRFRLMELYNNGNRSFCFDLVNVEDIDSISLGIFFSFGKMLKTKAEQGGEKIDPPVIENVETRLSNFFILTGLDQLYVIKLNRQEI